MCWGRWAVAVGWVAGWVAVGYTGCQHGQPLCPPRARAGFLFGSCVANYSKPHLTYRQQVDLLRSRGLVINDRDRAEEMLTRIGYYRLSGYWYPFRVPDGASRGNRFVAGTTFDQVLALYDMDRRLKLLVLEAVERVEIAMRVQVGYTLGKRDPHAHLHPQYLDGKFTRRAANQSTSRYDTWLERVRQAQDRSTEEFVQHFRDNYEGRLPVWVVTEIMDFGLLSYLYAGSRRDDRDAIAAHFGVLDAQGRGNGAALANWLQVLNYVRNVCAHHSRLWNRNMTVQVATRHLSSVPMLSHIHGSDASAAHRVYASLCVLGFLVRQVAPDQPWCADLHLPLDTGLAAAKRSATEMGFPSGWEHQPLWRT